LAAASTLSLPSNSANLPNKTNSSRQVGVKLADSLTKAKVKAVVLDRGRYRFHGRIKAFVEALKGNGIKI
ncbi:50S ribosomal protein L18, partial [Candidatus Collierbacteria bacterium]|nr:50S ribosomal protein L18 [Candidatus Collierbacteria bacterium]